MEKMIKAIAELGGDLARATERAERSEKIVMEIAEQLAPLGAMGAPDEGGHERPHALYGAGHVAVPVAVRPVDQVSYLIKSNARAIDGHLQAERRYQALKAASDAEISKAAERIERWRTTVDGHIKERDEIHTIAMKELAGDGQGEPDSLVLVIKALADRHDHHRRFHECCQAEIDEARKVITDARSWGHSHPEAPCMSPDLREELEHQEVVGLAAMIRRIAAILETRTGRVHELERANATLSEDLTRHERFSRQVNEMNSALHLAGVSSGADGINALGDEISRLRAHRERLERELAHEKEKHENTARDARQLIDDANRARDQAVTFRDDVAAKLREKEEESAKRLGTLKAIASIVHAKIEQTERPARAFAASEEKLTDSAARRQRTAIRGDAFREVLGELAELGVSVPA